MPMRPAGEQQVPPLRIPFPSGMGCSGRDDSLRRGYGNRETRLVIDDPFVPELLEELADVGANLGGIGVAELSL
jgi:hypothetical protein